MRRSAKVQHPNSRGQKKKLGGDDERWRNTFKVEQMSNEKKRKVGWVI